MTTATRTTPPDEIKSAADLAQLIDHTILKPDATASDLKKLCAEAREHNVLTVCVNACWISNSVAALAGSAVKVITVVGFPLGAATTAAKTFETVNALELGAQEIDMVLNIGALKSGLVDAVRDDIISVVQAARYAPVKVILETALLTDEEKRLASRLCVEAGASFVKTSTGFASGGATVEAIRLMRETVGDKCGVKASGGIRTLEQALALVAAGANRIGCSSTAAILAEAKVRFGK